MAALDAMGARLRSATNQCRRLVCRHDFASAKVAKVIRIGLTVVLVTGCTNHSAGDHLQIERFECKSGGDILSGILARPIEAEHFGVVVFVHGDGPVTADHDGGYRPIWAALARAGYASLS